MSALPAEHDRIQQKQATERLALIMTLLLVFLMAARTPVDTDLWWHLRAGEDTLTAGRPLLSDPYSFTRAGQPWSNHSWLAQVILAGAFHLGGYFALGLLVCLVVTLALALVYFQMSGPGLLRAFVTALVAAVSAPVWMPRPQIFSLLLFAFLGWLLQRFLRRGSGPLWLLPPLFALWANLHAGFPLGFALLFALIAGQVFDRLTGAPALSWPQISRLALALLVSVFALLANPGGIQAWRVPFQTVSVGALQNFIQEWASPNFHELSQQPFLWLLLACMAALGLAGRRAPAGDLFALLGFTALALMARRNFGPFALVAGPFLSHWLSPLLSSLAARVPPGWRRLGDSRVTASRFDPLKRMVNLFLVALIAFAALLKLYIVTQPVFVASVIDRAYPTQVIEWLAENQPPGRLFNAYNWGGFLVWNLPQYPVFVDGRTDLYGDEIIGQWMTVVQGGEGWQQILDHWDIRLMLLEPDRPVVALLEGQGWTLLVRQEGGVLYGR